MAMMVMAMMMMVMMTVVDRSWPSALKRNDAQQLFLAAVDLTPLIAAIIVIINVQFKLTILAAFKKKSSIQSETFESSSNVLTSY